jgi:hypothetical protein
MATDIFTTTDGQQEFSLINADPRGALQVFIEGAAAAPDEWEVDGGNVRLEYPLPEGRKVWVQEIRMEGGGNG